MTEQLSAVVQVPGRCPGNCQQWCGCPAGALATVRSGAGTLATVRSGEDTLQVPWQLSGVVQKLAYRFLASAFPRVCH